MNILFLTLLDFSSYAERNIYCDLIREFIRNGHAVYSISPVERREGRETCLLENGRLLKLKIGNTQKTNLLEKGISTLRIEPQFVAAIKRYFSGVRFDLVLYSTPPITLQKAVAYVKKRDGAAAYLLLKDIFPQNAVDLGMMSATGLKAPLYRYFRGKEKRLYALSDHIGCMSQANVDYVLKNNPEIPPYKVHVSPNSFEPQIVLEEPDRKKSLREKYRIPPDKTVFLYGGNLGRPQDVPFILSCLQASRQVEEAFFVVCGNGMDYPRLAAYQEAEKQENLLILPGLPRKEYEEFAGCCDVGLIFLDYRFTIPNFPSRLLSYMQKGMPVLACTDTATDIGTAITEGGFGWWCPSNDAEGFADLVRRVCREELSQASQKSAAYLLEHFSVKESYRAILHALEAGREQ